MFILILSEVFLPHPGGVEVVSHLLAKELACLGHDVSVMSNTKETSDSQEGYSIIRQPRCWKKLQIIKQADVVISQGGFCMRLGWPLLFLRKPIIIVRHMKAPKSAYSLPAKIKLFMENLSRMLFVSRFLALQERASASNTISNPFDANLFLSDGLQLRDRDILFIGTHNPSKGGAVLIDALKNLKDACNTVSVTMIGIAESAETTRLKTLGIGSEKMLDIVYLGHLSQRNIAAEMKRHKILVVPSLCEEAFGLVALEGIAAGCHVIASDAGGLPEAVGRCGYLFTPDNAEELANKIDACLDSKHSLNISYATRKAHLAKHLPHTVALEYLKHIHETIRSSD